AGECIRMRGVAFLRAKSCTSAAKLRFIAAGEGYAGRKPRASGRVEQGTGPGEGGNASGEGDLQRPAPPVRDGAGAWRAQGKCGQCPFTGVMHMLVQPSMPQG